MTNEENLRGMGMVVINAAFVLQLSWIPSLFFLAGADWLTAGAAVGAHRFALAFVAAAPLAYGARLWFNGDRAEAMTPWLLRCQIPLTVLAGLVYALERIVPHVSIPVIGGMMAATMLIGLYGLALRREGALRA
ncbi:MAG: hypothetical protein PHS14_01605 [Elusimicrobia bacterium]|nr:hypothetical protein [Elusimicrobiota bacterium]